MSNKKLRNRNAAPESHTDNPALQSAEMVPSNGRNWFSYLRSHLVLTIIIGLVTVGALGSVLKYLDDDAQRIIAQRKAPKTSLDNQEESFLNKVNPFLPAPLPPPTPQLSKEYLYAGSRLLVVEDAAANAAPPADLAIWRPSSGQWWVMAGTGTQQVTQSWGTSGDTPVAGDYDGDGKTDFAVYRPSTGYWYLVYSSTGGTTSFQYGTSGDTPVPADYDGDGKTDIAVFRNSNTTWYINYSSTGANVYATYGTSGDTPAPADFDGDGKADLAVYRDTSHMFYSLNTTNQQTASTYYGTSGDKPVPADYDGDGKADVALWRSGNATWYIRQSSNASDVTVQFGIATDTPVRNDYDGDGKCDIAVWRGLASSSPGGDVGKWYIRNSSNVNNIRIETWGISGDVPVPAFWKRQ